MNAPSISLCMIVKNEERTLERCLDSVTSLAPEMIIVDTGSTDRTPAIAARYGAAVIPFDFDVADFGAARNQALGRAKGRWILSLDADEILDPASAPLIPKLTARGENAGYYFQRLNRQVNSESTTIDHVVRLFPNRPGYRFRARVHETIDESILAGGGRLVTTAVRIHHDFALDPEERRRRNLWYIQILQEEIAANPNDSSRLDFLAAEYHQLGMFDEAAVIAERIVRLRPLDPYAHLYVGTYHLVYQHDPARARADLQEALRLRPGFPEALSFLELIDRQVHGKPSPPAPACPSKT